MNNTRTSWPEGVGHLARDLHSKLTINEKNWHRLKTNSDRRTAELLAGGLVQLIQGGHPSDIEALIRQALLWHRKELNDPGCPKH